MGSLKEIVSIIAVFMTLSTKYSNAQKSVTSLPKTLMPTLYNLSLIVYPETENYIGTINITFDVLDGQTVKDIYLNVDPNYINVQDVLINNIIRPRVGISNEENILDVNFTLGISGEDNIIYISFVGKYSEDYGLVQTSYTVDDKELFKIKSQFETGYASRAFPCMNEADLKANFSVEIHHSANYTATTNTEIISEDCTESLIVTTYAVTDKISPDYLYILIEDAGQSNTSSRAILPREMQCDDGIRETNKIEPRQQ